MIKKAFILSILVGIIFACSKEQTDKNEGSSTTSSEPYNTGLMLTNWADNIIIPSYENFQTKVTALEEAIATFSSTTTQENLNIVREKWEAVYVAFQHIGFYTIGKADALKFLDKTNLYPVNSADIDANITSGVYDFDLISQYDSQGLGALDYMLFGLAESDVALLAHYTTNKNASNYKKYLVDLVAEIKSNTNSIVSDWKQNYRNSYISNTKNTINGSVNQTVNGFMEYFEKNIRAAKVGIPAGIYSGNRVLSSNTEAYYKNDLSKKLLIESVIVAKNFFNGKHFGTTTGEGLSLKSYLQYVGAVRNNTPLEGIVNTQFEAIITQANTLNASFTEQINQNNTIMISMFDTLQKQVVYLKLDVMQALNIAIDYVDADGD